MRLLAATTSRLHRALGLPGLEQRVATLGSGQVDLNRGYSDDIRRVWELFAAQEARIGRLERLTETVTVMAWVEQATLANEPLISVIVPTRNRAGLLERAINSVRDQTYQNWELLINGDGSSDGTADLVTAIDDDRVRWLAGELKGSNAARNRGLDHARGELIAYLDDDNRMHPGWLKAVAWAFEQRPEVDILHGGVVIDDTERIRGEGGVLPSAWMERYDRATIEDANVADASAIAHRAGLESARFEDGADFASDWTMFRRATADRDPLSLPAIACFYYTDAPGRMSKIRRPRPRLAAAQALGSELEITDWSLDPDALETVLAEVDGGCETIIECGSGVSTILIGRMLRERKRGSLYSLEHDPVWVTLGRSRLAAEGLDAYVQIIDAPLESTPKAAQGCLWYAKSSLAHLPERGVEMLLVDGPPALPGSSERSRYPALPMLASRLAPNARLIFDDIDRSGEAWMLERWRREFPLSGLRRSGALALARLGAPAMNL